MIGEIEKGMGTLTRLGDFKSITESELKRRLTLIHYELFDTNGTFEKAIDLLLHGEGKEKPPHEWTPKQLAKHVINGEEKVGTLPNYDTPCYICKKAANLHEPWCSRGVSKQAHLATMPSPASTREEWAENIAVSFVDSSRERNILELKARILSMPTGPR